LYPELHEDDLDMTRLLNRGIKAVSALSTDRQDVAGKLLLELAGAPPTHVLTPEQVEDVKKAVAEADRGEFATDAEVKEAWRKFGL